MMRRAPGVLATAQYDRRVAPDDDEPPGDPASNRGDDTDTVLSFGGPTDVRGNCDVTDPEDESPIRDNQPLLLGYRRRDRIGRYVLHETLGAGASGAVFAALDPQQSRTIAVKVIRLEASATDSGEGGRLLGDAAALAALRHTNVLEVYDVGRQGGDVFIAMELVQGGTLAQWIERARRPWRQTLTMMVHAGRGLAAAHDLAIVHRNFSADNVLVGSDGRVRVSDFGLAFTASPRYAAPEQVDGRPLDARADQFAFAVVLFEALTCRRAAAGATVDDLQRAIQSSERVPPAELEAMPSVIRAAIARALAIEPAERFPTLDALLQVLESGIGRQHMLTLGIPPSGARSRALREAEQLTTLFESKFHLSVDPWIAANYNELVAGIVQGRIDVAWLPPVAFAKALVQGVRAVAVARRSGAKQFRGALIVRTDSNIQGIADLGGRRMAWVDVESASGYLLPRALIAASVEDADAFLGAQQLLGSHRAVVQAVLHGFADCGATFAYCDESGVPLRSGWQQYLGDRAVELRPIAFTASTPGDAIAVRAEFVSTPQCTSFVSALRAMVDEPQGRAVLDVVFNQIDGFDDPDVDFYEQVRDMLSLLP
jgi:phosphate/phosphite/phosphonate ABC transporter binding protein